MRRNGFNNLNDMSRTGCKKLPIRLYERTAGLEMETGKRNIAERVMEGAWTAAGGALGVQGAGKAWKPATRERTSEGRCIKF